jgi:hypothetical protein
MPANTKRSRLTIDVSPELRRRVKIAATRKDLSVSEYVSHILETAVPTEKPEEKQKGRLVTDETIERFNRTRERIMRGRVFTDDSTDIINEGRLERTAELERASGYE